MNGKYKSILQYALVLVIFIFFARYIILHAQDFKQLKINHPEYISLLFVLAFIASSLNGLIVKFITEPFKILLKAKEWFGLSIVTSFYNTILPLRGGAFARAIYLKNNHNFSYLDFLATLSGVYVLSFLIASGAGLLSLTLLYKQGIFNPIVLAIFLLVFLLMLIIVVFTHNLPQSSFGIINKFIRVVNGWHQIKKYPSLLAKLSILTICQLTISVLITISSYAVFNIHISLAQGLLLAALGTLGGVLAITPASLGIAETISVFSALVIGITPVQSLAAALLTRAVSTIFIIILGPIFSYVLIKKNDKKS